LVINFITHPNISQLNPLHVSILHGTPMNDNEQAPITLSREDLYELGLVQAHFGVGKRLRNL